MRPARFLRTCTVLASDNLRGGRGHAVYLVITLVISVAAWLVLAALAAPFVGSGTSASTGPGVTITNGSQIHSPLPLRYARRIKAIPGARDVAWFTLMIVSCGQDEQLTLNVWGGPGTASQVSPSQHPISPAVVRRWDADPLGILLSTKAAADCGWSTGESVEPPVAFGTKHVSLHISGVFHGKSDVAFAHYDYINRIGSVFGKDKVLKYVASSGNARDNERLAARIEAEFAHDFPTVNATTNATVQNAWARFGKAQQLLAFVMAAILLCTASVLISVLAHAATQRRAKIALLQVLGFQRATLFGAFALELLAVVVLGALLGIGLAKLVGHELAPTTFGFLSGGVQIPLWAWWGLPAWLAVLVVVALAWPAGLIARVRPADYRAI